VLMSTAGSAIGRPAIARAEATPTSPF